MVICLRLEIDDAFESDLETLKYIVYQGILRTLFINNYKLFFSSFSRINRTSDFKYNE
jgi:hypothetical protein